MMPVLRGTAAVIVVAGALFGTAPANATPGTDINAVTLAQTQIPPNLIPFVAGTDVVVREITVAPGGSTGWHYHDGPVLGFVRAGTLTHPGADCIPQIYRAGDFIIEPAGADNVHSGRNIGADTLILDVVYLPPTGRPLFVDAPAPDCA